IPQGDRYGIASHSQMLEGKEPSESSSDGQRPPMPVAGDRHAVAYEKSEREKAAEGLHEGPPPPPSSSGQGKEQ
ncbi:hypothetical protein KC336_g20753, partial [Hortaea werneckii]